MVAFLVSSGKKQISPLLATPGKLLEKSPGAPPPGKNHSDPQRLRMEFVFYACAGPVLDKISVFVKSKSQTGIDVNTHLRTQQKSFKRDLIFF